MHLRHGDLAFRSVNKLPIGKTKKVLSYILAEGEYTGHNHNLALQGEGSISVVSVDDSLFFEIEGSDAELTHPEHKTIVFKPGIYEMKHEKEFDYFMKAIRQVRD